MIILFPKGRLGNQLFQYNFVKTKFNDEFILTNHSSFFKCFNDPFKNYLRVNSLNSKILNRVFLFLSNTKIISSLKEVKFF